LGFGGDECAAIGEDSGEAHVEAFGFGVVFGVAEAVTFAIGFACSFAVCEPYALVEPER